MKGGGDDTARKASHKDVQYEREADEETQEEEHKEAQEETQEEEHKEAQEEAHIEAQEEELGEEDGEGDGEEEELAEEDGEGEEVPTSLKRRAVCVNHFSCLLPMFTSLLRMSQPSTEKSSHKAKPHSLKRRMVRLLLFVSLVRFSCSFLLFTPRSSCATAQYRKGELQDPTT
jgi:hypothetical protein